MKLLVVGAAGQLGSDLVSEADAHGLTRADLDVADLDAIPEVLGRFEFDALVNCTAYNDTAGAESDAGTAFQVNARAPEALAIAAREAGARFVHVSTDYVFDGSAGRPYTEEDAPAPLGVYGASKLTGEAMARRAHPDGTLVIRTAALFGVSAAVHGGNFVETILKAAPTRAREDRPLEVVSDVVVSPTATADLATGILALLRTGAEPGIYHLVNQGEASWFDFARAIVELEALDVRVDAVPSSRYPSPVRRPPFSVLDSGKAAAVIGTLPPWREGLERYLKERRRHASNPAST